MNKRLLILMVILMLQGAANHLFSQNKIDVTREDFAKNKAEIKIDEGNGKIDSAKENYNIGRFRECINSLKSYLRNTNEKNELVFNHNQKIKAYRLIAKSFLAMDSVTSADNSIRELLMLREDYIEDPTDPDPKRFVNELKKVRAEYLKNMVTSISKVNEDPKIAPATNMVITREQILQRGYTDLIDILKDIPGFDVSVYYGKLYANVYQRGLRTNNTEKTLLLFDGVEDNDMWSNFADISQQYPLSNIKRIEVIYGPSSTIYGANAFSGVINVITKEPDDYFKNNGKFGITANAGYGTYNSKYMDVSTALKSGIFSFTLTGRFYKSNRPDLSSQELWNYDPSIFDSGDFSDSAYQSNLSIGPNQGYNYLSRYNLDKRDTSIYRYRGSVVPIYRPPDSIEITRNGLDFARSLDKAAYSQNDYTRFNNPSQSSYVSAKVNIGDLSLGFVTWAKAEGAGTTYTDRVASVNGSLWKPKHEYLFLDYNKRLSDQFVFSTLINYRIHSIRNGSKITSLESYGLRYLELKDLADSTAPQAVSTYYFEQSTQFRSEFKLTYNNYNNFHAVSGLELRNGQIQGDLLSSINPIPQEFGTFDSTIIGGNQFNVTDIGFYTQGTYRTNGIGFTGGARLDYNKIRQSGGYGYKFNPRVVIDYKLGHSIILKAIYSTGIQNVSNFTKYAFDRFKLISNPDLATESISNYELSAAYYHTITSSKENPKSLNADIDFYYNYVKNVVGEVIVDSLNARQNRVIGNFKVKGIQANLSFLSKPLQASINYSFTKSRQTDSLGFKVDNIVGDIASHKVNAIVNYSFLKNFNINLRANYVGNKKVGEGTTVPQNTQTFKSYILGNIALSACDLINGVTVQLICNNIFDKLYYSPGISSAGGSKYPDRILQMGRNFSFRINYEF